MNEMNPAELREIRRDATVRTVDLAGQLGIPEAALLEAELGHCVTRIDPTLSRLFPALETLGEVMALTRNPSCVIEKIGHYRDFHDGDHAAMTLDPEIDMRMFPRHWAHAYAVNFEGKRSIQVFDRSGTAVHKVHLRDTSSFFGFETLTQQLALPDQKSLSEFEPVARPEGARIAPDKVDVLRQEWARMTDTHQFNTLVHRLKMNRLGAYRAVGGQFARRLDPLTTTSMFETVRDLQLPIMLFVGNKGCIEIHSGPVGELRQMGPWFNILDARFNLHLRSDHLAELWAVEKPTRRGPAISVEAFDPAGELIFQCYGVRAEKGGDLVAWAKVVSGLPDAAEA